MKKFSYTVILFLVVLFISKTTFAQSDNIVIVTTWYVENPEDGSPAEFDSLSTVMNDKVISKNSKIISRTMVRHMWGSDSRQRVIITEYANMEDVELADKEGSKLFKEAFPSEEDRKAFGSAYRKYWNGHHSDEIYSVVSKK